MPQVTVRAMRTIRYFIDTTFDVSAEEAELDPEDFLSLLDFNEWELDDDDKEVLDFLVTED